MVLVEYFGPGHNVTLLRSGVSISRCDATRRRRHEFRADRIAYSFTQDSIDLGLCRGINSPARYFINRRQLIGMTRAPQAPW